jgi:hypothetical protein
MAVDTSTWLKPIRIQLSKYAVDLGNMLPALALWAGRSREALCPTPACSWCATAWSFQPRPAAKSLTSDIANDEHRAAT